MRNTPDSPRVLFPSQRGRLWLVFLITAVLAAACQGTDSAQEVFDFNEIAEAGPVIDTHPSGTSATLR